MRDRLHLDVCMQVSRRKTSGAKKQLASDALLTTTGQPLLRGDNNGRAQISMRPLWQRHEGRPASCRAAPMQMHCSRGTSLLSLALCVAMEAPVTRSPSGVPVSTSSRSSPGDANLVFPRNSRCAAASENNGALLADPRGDGKFVERPHHAGRPVGFNESLDRSVGRANLI